MPRKEETLQQAPQQIHFGMGLREVRGTGCLDTDTAERSSEGCWEK